MLQLSEAYPTLRDRHLTPLLFHRRCDQRGLLRAWAAERFARENKVGEYLEPWSGEMMRHGVGRRVVSVRGGGGCWWIGRWRQCEGGIGPGDGGCGAHLRHAIPLPDRQLRLPAPPESPCLIPTTTARRHYHEGRNVVGVERVVAYTREAPRVAGRTGGTRRGHGTAQLFCSRCRRAGFKEPAQYNPHHHTNHRQAARCCVHDRRALLTSQRPHPSVWNGIAAAMGVGSPADGHTPIMVVHALTAELYGVVWYQRYPQRA